MHLDVRNNREQDNICECQSIYLLFFDIRIVVNESKVPNYFIVSIDIANVTRRQSGFPQRLRLNMKKNIYRNQLHAYRRAI